MASRKIKLGDEVQDVTSKTIGIAIARTEHLNGAIDFLLQPYTTDDNEMLRPVAVPEQYLVYKGTGVYPDNKPPMGFVAENVPR
jgi:hypothetical protein